MTILVVIIWYLSGEDDGESPRYKDRSVRNSCGG